MPFVFELLISAIIGYLLGPLVFILFPFIIGGIIFYLAEKGLFIRYIERQKDRRKLKRLLKERLKHLP